MKKILPKAGEIHHLKPGICRLTAPNAGLMTGPGTNTYILGEKEFGIIDPGPHIDRHIQKILEFTQGNISWILVTHTHQDHSPAVSSLAKTSGAEVLGIPPPLDGHQDMTFQPDRELKEGELLTTKEFELTVIHTPGHASNHLCYLETQHKWLFTGDHIMDGSTVVINPPDGRMGEYLNSMHKLTEKTIKAIAPGHGAIIDNPYEVIDWIIKHRLKREKKVLKSLKENPNLKLSELVELAYNDVNKSIYPLAERSLLAHLIKLSEDNLARNHNDRWEMIN
jgi:glyoxylase-like metal-dependent hydrolase (beta-lactamase superfamily II)